MRKRVYFVKCKSLSILMFLKSADIYIQVDYYIDFYWNV